MARTGSLDPLSSFRYIVHIRIDNNYTAFERLGFESVTLPRVDIQKTQVRELGRHLNPRNIVEGATFSPITLRRGKSYGQDFYNWMALLYRSFYGDKNGNNSNYRGTIVIDHMDRLGKVTKKYIILAASPSAYIPGSNLNSMDDSEVCIETLMLDYEGYIELSLGYSAITALAGSAVGAILGKLGDLKPGFTSEVDEAVQSINARKAPKSF
jgi:phage tail-like protein